MGNLFIENEHEYDLEKHYYCKCCKVHNNNHIEICSTYRRSNVECETIGETFSLFLDISFNNINVDEKFINIEIHPNNEHTFIILDLEPVEGRGIGRNIYCKYCFSNLGIVCIFHFNYKTYEKTFFMKNLKLI